jgi:hypothetical protein
VPPAAPACSQQMLLGRAHMQGKKAAAIIIAEGQAECRKIDADSRNDAADAMSDPFARKFALMGQQVTYAQKLKVRLSRSVACRAFPHGQANARTPHRPRCSRCRPRASWAARCCRNACWHRRVRRPNIDKHKRSTEVCC